MTFTTLIDTAALQKMVGKPATTLIDCRFDLADPGSGRRAYLVGHIPGARYADLNQDLSGPVSASSGRHPLPAPADLATTLRRLGVRPDIQVIAYDDSAGAFAARLWWLLRWMGHSSVAVLDGGLKAWLAAGGALESGPAGPEPAASAGAADSTHRVDASAVLDAANIAELLKDPKFLLIDARAPERFAGTVEPIDAVAGHVAGAVNQPFSANLAADGRFLPATDLRDLWERRLAGKNPNQVAAMCGSGVTACHNLLSLEIAGLRGAKLYPGSWSEWIRDPNRPIVRGA